ncbi:MAG TPA: hypothetical protein VFY06_08355 [Verrucomicrobiae bacterium]|nr:hypothetical protein [Verrucomicrobiae bacterium]
MPKYTNFPALKIEMPGHELDFQPWISWASSQNPQWWKSYNQVKHKRNEFFRDANLGNLLESSSGLLVMLVYQHQPELYNQFRVIQPDFKAMRIDSKCAHALRWGFDYDLPDFGKSSILNLP